MPVSTGSSKPAMPKMKEMSTKEAQDAQDTHAAAKLKPLTCTVYSLLCSLETQLILPKNIAGHLA